MSGPSSHSPRWVDIGPIERNRHEDPRQTGDQVVDHHRRSDHYAQHRITEHHRRAEPDQQTERGLQHSE